MIDKNTLWDSLTSTDIKELEGFEELIEYWGKNNIKKASKRRSMDHTIEYKEIINFLENENNRLNKIYHFLHNKVSTLQNFDQKEALIHFENERLDTLKEKLYKKLSQDDSTFQTTIGEIFDRSFKS
jgi:hypothetical protein